jgi:hypothetical protein
MTYISESINSDQILPDHAFVGSPHPTCRLVLVESVELDTGDSIPAVIGLGLTGVTAP